MARCKPPRRTGGSSEQTSSKKAATGFGGLAIMRQACRARVTARLSCGDETVTTDAKDRSATASEPLVTARRRARHRGVTPRSYPFVMNEPIAHAPEPTTDDRRGLTPSRADLHVHSKFSDRPSEWLLRRIGAPESFTEPLEVYRRAKARGMAFVTISDHNRIEGALEIAHLPGTFVSNEVTTYFPEDGCKIHCLVSGITEAQHREIEQLRGSIYELRDFLHAENIAHSVAHPLYSVNDRLTAAHVEKLLVLFKRFEAINGARDPRACDLFVTICAALTPETLHALAERHRLEPHDAEPWVKWFTGGSDDHGGLHIAGAWTETPVAETVEDYLAQLRAGAHRPGGSAGSSLKLAHSFYSIGHSYYRDRLLKGLSEDLAGDLFKRFLGDGAKTPAEPAPAERWKRIAFSFLKPRDKKAAALDASLVEGFANLVSLHGAGPSASAERRAFAEASRLSQRLTYETVRKLSRHLRRGRLSESLQSLSALGPVALCFAPYLAAFHTQHKDERMLQGLAEHFPSARHLRRRSEKKAWVTDTLADVNGVAVTVQTVGALARRHGRPLHVLTSLKNPPQLDLELVNFPPVGEFRLPEYDAQKLAFPPFLELIEHFEREGYDEILISTPGPMGLMGLAAARLLGMRATGIYHTDFPAYVRHLTGSTTLAEWTWKLSRWFFGRMDALYVPSTHTMDRLAERGFSRSTMRLLPRGVDFVRFNPGRRDPSFYRRLGLGEGFRFLYVGRVSKEKNLDALLAAFQGFLDGGGAGQLIVVGDGPYLEELRERHRRPDVLFTGFLHGEALATAFASADLFVFPSTTDTFGNVVLEAQASGLAAIVSHRGGPQEIVGPSGAGLVIDPHRPGALAEAMLELAQHDAMRRAMGERALASAQRSGWEALLEDLWTDKPPAPASIEGLAAVHDEELAPLLDLASY
jgi:glycosyltransferase involved in cell wall biosynthesis